MQMKIVETDKHPDIKRKLRCTFEYSIITIPRTDLQ